jgi:hypothetical protein
MLDYQRNQHFLRFDVVLKDIDCIYEDIHLLNDILLGQQDLDPLYLAKVIIDSVFLDFFLWDLRQRELILGNDVLLFNAFNQRTFLHV